MLRRILNGVLFTAFTIGAAVVLTEIASRLLFPEWAPVAGDRRFWAYDRDLGWSHTPGASGRLSYVDFSAAVSINSDGLRDRDYPLEKGSGSQRMLVLGDSFAWGYGVEQGEIFAELIEARRPDWEIVNAAVSGYGTDQEYLYYTLRGSRYRPDVVLLLFCQNDFDNSASAIQYWHNKPLFVPDGEGIRLTNVPVPEMTTEQVAGNFIARNTYFLRVVSRLAASWRSGAGSPDGAHAAAGAPDVESQGQSTLLPRKAELVLRILLALSDAVRARDGRLVVVSLPGRYPLFADPRFAAAGISHLSLTEAFRGAAEPVQFAHDMHWTAAGHRMVAAAVEEYLIEIGVFEADTHASR